MDFKDPFVVGFCALFGVMALMFFGQLGYRLVTQRGLSRDDRARRRMKHLRKIPIAPKRSNPSHSTED